MLEEERGCGGGRNHPVTWCARVEEQVGRRPLRKGWWFYTLLAWRTQA